VTAVQTKVLDKLRSPDLRVYWVWLPILPRDDLAVARRSAAQFPDTRGIHFWDGERALGWSLGELLTLPARDAAHAHGVAWDVYLLYARGVRWKPGAAAPSPTFWMHQLWGADKLAPLLDGAVLRTRVETLLQKRARG
jgi:hypothetical protein